MELNEILQKMLIGGLFGLIGQVLRTVIGMKKLSETAASKGLKLKDVFETFRFTLSLIIGFASGVIAIFFIDQFETIENNEQFASLIGIGYAGTDFLEGFISKYIPKSNHNSKEEITNTNTSDTINPIDNEPEALG